MPAPLSLDLRQRILAAHLDEKQSVPLVAQRFGVAQNTVRRLAERFRSTGSALPKPHGGGPVPLLHDDDRAQIEACLKANPSMTHEEMARRFEKETTRRVSRPTMARYLAGWGITRKKRP